MSFPNEIAPGIKVGNSEPLLLIAGPCQIESRDHALFTAQAVKEIASQHSVSFIYKSSYDKANRTSISGKRGLGIEEGLRILSDVRKEIGVPVLTDVHSPEEAIEAGKIVDVLQTPAFLCRQTELLVAAGKSGKAVNIKKGQFLAPEDMKFAAEKVLSGGATKVLLCERGTSFGYRDLVVDMRSLLLMADTGYPVIFDATHSVQVMGGSGSGQSGGQRRFIRPLVKAAVAVGVDGIFIECHEQPSRAPSDGASMLELSELASLLKEATAHRLR